MKYEVNGVEYNVWSSKNQRIIDKFVDREVYANVTSMTEFILQNSHGDACGEAPFNYEDIENAYVDNSDRIEELNDYLEELNEELEELESEIEELESDLESTREGNYIVFTHIFISFFIFFLSDVSSSLPPSFPFVLENFL